VPAPTIPDLGVRCSAVAHPTAWDDLLEPFPDRGALAQPAPEFELDQRISG